MIWVPAHDKSVRSQLTMTILEFLGKGSGNFKLSDALDSFAHAPKAGMGAMNRSS